MSDIATWLLVAGLVGGAGVLVWGLLRWVQHHLVLVFVLCLVLAVLGYFVAVLVGGEA